MSEASQKSGCKVYFGGLTEATGITTEESFKALLEKEDVTPQCSTEENIEAGTNVWIKSGYAFAMFDGEESAKDAISKFNGYVLNGTTIVAEIAKDSDENKSINTCVKLWCLSDSVTQRTLEPIISRFGKVEAIEFTPGGGVEKDTRSVVITYQTKEEAEEAVKNLQNYELSGSTLQAQITEKTERKLSYPNERQNTSNSTKKMMNEKGSPTNGAQKGAPGNGRLIDFPLRVLVQSEMVGAIIGRSGQTIKQITQQSRARVDVHRKENVGSIEKAITIYGQPENCTAACLQIMKVMQEEAKNTGKPEDMTLKILAHNNLVGRIIGKQGATIKRIMDDTDTKIAVSSISEISNFNMERIITVKGEIENMSKAEAEISSKLRAAYEADVQAMAPQSIMFPGLHPTAMMSTVGISGMMGGGAGGFHPGANAAGPMGAGGPMNNLAHPLGGNRPGHTHHAHGPGHQGGPNSGFAGFNGGGPPHSLAGQNNHGMGLVGHHPHGPQINPAISKANLGLAGHGNSGFNGKDQHLNNSQAAALAAAMSGLNMGGGAANGNGMGGGPHNSSTLQQETSYLHIPNTSVGAVIGTKGSHIRNIIKFSGANVKIAPNNEEEKDTTAGPTPTADGLPSPTDRRVTIVGSPESQWKAQYLICEKLREEGFASGLADIRLIVEIMVPASQVGRIIGKGGANVRELQRVTGALIKLPEQGTTTGEEISVHIVGTFYSVQSAQRRLRAMVEVALNGGSINIGAVNGPLHHPMNGGPPNQYHRDAHMLGHGVM